MYDIRGIFLRIAASEGFLRQRAEYWGFLLAFSALISGPEGFKTSWWNKSLALSAFVGMVTTMVNRLLLEVTESNPRKLRERLIGLGLICDFVFMSITLKLFLS